MTRTIPVIVIALALSLAGRLLGVDAEGIKAANLKNANLELMNNHDPASELENFELLPGYEVNHYFTDTNNWFVRTNAPNGMCWFEREAVEFKRDTDFDTDNAKAKAYMRFSAGWTDWRGVYGSLPA